MTISLLRTTTRVLAAAAVLAVASISLQSFWIRSQLAAASAENLELRADYEARILALQGGIDARDAVLMTCSPPEQPQACNAGFYRDQANQCQQALSAVMAQRDQCNGDTGEEVDRERVHRSEAEDQVSSCKQDLADRKSDLSACKYDLVDCNSYLTEVKGAAKFWMQRSDDCEAAAR